MMASNPAKTGEYNLGTIVAYGTFLSVAGLVYHRIAEGEFSSILTISAIFQCLAVSLLGVQVLSSGNVSGISVAGLKLDALALVCRLASTTWLNGYIPSDATGDFMYQGFDVFCLGVIVWLMHYVVTVKSDSYEAEADCFPVSPLGIACFVFAAAFHADLNDSPLFDSIWMCGHVLGLVAVVPQLWMMTRRGGKSLPALTSHFVAVMGFARMMNGLYMWEARDELTCEPWIGEFNHASPAILGSHLIHLFLLGDFIYFYVKHVTNSGLDAPLELPGVWMV